MKRNHIFILSVTGLICLGIYHFFSPFYGTKENLDKKPKTLNIYTWLDFIPPTLQQKFERETGVKLHIDYIDSDEALEAKLLTGKTSYDVVYPSTPYVFRHMKLGLYQPLNLTKIPNIKNIDLDFIEDFKHENTVYSLPYLWGSSGFAYDVDSIKPAFADESINSWSYVLNPEKLRRIAPKGIAATASSNELFCAMAFWQGHSLKEDIAQEDIEQATLKAKLARPYWRVFLSSEAAIQALGSGEVAVAFIWNGDAVAAAKLASLQKRKIQYVIPKEGTLKWVDSLAIPHNSQSIELAHQFINFLLEPKHMAEVTNYVQFANTSSSSKKFIRSDILNNPILYPNPSDMKNLILDKRVDPKFERTINRHFFKILVGY